MRTCRGDVAAADCAAFAWEGRVRVTRSPVRLALLFGGSALVTLA